MAQTMAISALIKALKAVKPVESTAYSLGLPSVLSAARPDCRKIYLASNEIGRGRRLQTFPPRAPYQTSGSTHSRSPVPAYGNSVVRMMSGTPAANLSFKMQVFEDFSLTFTRG